MNRNDGGLAFPLVTHIEVLEGGYASGREYKLSAAGGMTLRDYFAAKAMAAQLANPQWVDAAQVLAGERSRGVESIVAEAAYDLADAMLARRNA